LSKKGWGKRAKKGTFSPKAEGYQLRENPDVRNKGISATAGTKVRGEKRNRKRTRVGKENDCHFGPSNNQTRWVEEHTWFQSKRDESKKEDRGDRFS